MIPKDELKAFLDEKAALYEARWFIDDDPVQIPHLFANPRDIEIAGLLAATLAWGRRQLILNKCKELMNRMDMAPHDFVIHANKNELSRLSGFVYRTFNSIDLNYFIIALKQVYQNSQSLSSLFYSGYQDGIEGALVAFRKEFLSFNPPLRTGKHVANVIKNSSAKRLNMFLRWMVRRGSPVDFGLWEGIDPAHLLMPLDLHVGRVARTLGLLTRKQNDFIAVKELTGNLCELRPHDPVFYDYALFGLGVYEGF